MANIVIDKFMAMVPNIADDKKGVGDAALSFNTYLKDGRLMGMRQPKFVRSAGNAESWKYLAPLGNENCKDCGGFEFVDYCAGIYRDNSTDCYGFDTIVVLSHTNNREHVVRKRCRPKEEVPLCTPAPEQALTPALQPAVTDPNAPAPEQDACVWTYTFVNEFGKESPPAPPSRVLNRVDGQPVILTGFSPIPNGTIAVRIYRTMPGLDDGSDRSMVPRVEYHLIEEVEATPNTGLASYVDDKRMVDMDMFVLETQGDCCPPTSFCGSAQTENGYLVGYKGNEIWFSENMNVHNWPVHHKITLQDTITGIVAVENVVFVVTEGFPYKIAISPTDDEIDDISVHRFPMPEPCYNGKTLTMTPHGAMYMGKTGLILLPMTGQSINLTRDTVPPLAWPGFACEVGEFHNGYYYGFNRKNGVVFRVSEVNNTSVVDSIWKHGIEASGVMRGEDNELYIDSFGIIQKWGAGSDWARYTWRSGDFIQPHDTTYGALRVVGDFGDEVKVTIFCNYTAVHTAHVKDDKPIRLPRLPRGARWSIMLEGETPISRVVLAHSVQEANV